MENESFDHVTDILGCTYTGIAREARKSRTCLVNSLLAQRQLPVEGWSSLEVKQFLFELSATDANSQIGQASVGEREGRVFSEVPKAVGSSLLYRLTSYLALHAVKICGIQAAARCLPVPLATGMSLSLCLSALRRLRPHADVVVISRIDQKSCIKAVSHAGLKLKVVDQLVGNDGALVTDLDAIQKAIAEATPRVLCVMSTTSSFAPRQPDLIPQIAEMCKRMDVFHLVNNAYGLQCSKCCALVEQACRVGQVDLVVSSCDKNFLTPVGGSLIYGPDPLLVANVSASYPGRASMSPILDLFITLLQMGQTGLQHLLRERKRLFLWFKEELVATCDPRGLRVLPSPHNKISIALDLSAFSKGGREDTAKAISFLGSQLFLRRCSGLRVVVPSTAVTEIAGYPFRSFGSHCEYPVPYCSVACAIGADEKELRLFLERFRHLVDQSLKCVRLPSEPQQGAPSEEGGKSGA
ncbi:hypothetical protein Emag_000455 [Eimeria magna]